MLDRPIANRDPQSREILGALFEKALAEADSDFVFALKSVLRGQIGANRLTRKNIAHAMGLSEYALIGVRQWGAGRRRTTCGESWTMRSY